MLTRSNLTVAGQVAAIPVVTASGKTRSFGLLEGLGIPKSSTNAGPAKEFIKWMTSKEFQIHNYSNGVLPTRTSALADLQKAGTLISGEAWWHRRQRWNRCSPRARPPGTINSHWR